MVFLLLPFLTVVPLCEVPNVHTSLPHLYIKVYSINLYVVIHYIVRYYILVPITIQKQRYIKMKKKLLFATIILVLLAGILYYISLPDYLVFNSMSFSNGANRDTELQVIVYQYWNTDEVIAEIEAEHNQINGTPTILTINLYHSKWSFRNGYEPFYSTTINYN